MKFIKWFKCAFWKGHYFPYRPVYVGKGEFYITCKNCDKKEYGRFMGNDFFTFYDRAENCKEKSNA